MTNAMGAKGPDLLEEPKNQSPKGPKNRSERQLRAACAKLGLKLSKPRWRGAGWWVLSGERKVTVIRDATLGEVEDFLTAGGATRKAVIEIAEILHKLVTDDDDATWGRRVFIIDAVRALVRETLAGKLSPDAVAKAFAAIRTEVCELAGEAA